MLSPCCNLGAFLLMLLTAALYLVFGPGMRPSQLTIPEPVIEHADPYTNNNRSIKKKACDIHLAYLRANPGTVRPLSLYEYLSIPQPGSGTLHLDTALRAFMSISQAIDQRFYTAEDDVGRNILAANLLMDPAERSVYDSTFLPALRGELGGHGTLDERAAAGLVRICGWRRKS
ncbi:hypothetical protein LY76DRAFT_650710 [Colletotrichum caudatum]|nr:hypothetical protein LY76DRAFT_650710 [Colletotrichum caudatum]